MAKNPAGPTPAFEINTTGWQRQGNDLGVQNYGAGGDAGQQVWDNPQQQKDFWTTQATVDPRSQEYYGGTTQTEDSSTDDSSSKQGAFENTSSGGSGKQKWSMFDDFYYGNKAGQMASMGMFNPASSNSNQWQAYAQYMNQEDPEGWAEAQRKTNHFRKKNPMGGFM